MFRSLWYKTLELKNSGSRPLNELALLRSKKIEGFETQKRKSSSVAETTSELKKISEPQHFWKSLPAL